MADPIYKVDHDEQQLEAVNVDLIDVPDLQHLKKGMIREPTFLKEANRGTIGKIAMGLVASLMLILPLAGGLIAAFASADQAHAYTSIVVALLEAVGRFGIILMWPVMAYYFIKLNNRSAG